MYQKSSFAFWFLYTFQCIYILSEIGNMFSVLSQIFGRENDDLLSSFQRSNFNCFQGVLTTSG